MAGISAVASAPSATQDFVVFLRGRNILNEEQWQAFQDALARSKAPAHSVLLERGFLSEEEIDRFRSEFLGLPLYVPEGEGKLSEEILKHIPEEAARRYRFVPLRSDDTTLDVGMVEPEDVLAQEALRFLLSHEGRRANIFLLTPTVFETIIKQYRSFHGEVEEALSELDKTLAESAKVSAPDSRREEQQKELVEDAPVIKMVGVIIRQAIEGKASDIHIEPGASRLRVRFRVDGILYTSLFLPMTVHAAMISRIKILAVLKIDETRRAQDGRFRTMVDGKPIDFRVSTFPTVFGEKTAIRLLDPATGLRSIENLGVVGQTRRILEEAIRRPFGMILMTGPTGSGKSTTLYALLQTIKSDEVNIVTLEDPVEYFIEGINQSQVNHEIGYTFATGLRHILRGDPNVIMVGEIRDAETAELAVHAALTGHLMFSTLHTNNAIGVVPRLVDLGIDTFLIPPTLLAAVAQRLVRTLCTDCRKPRELYPKERELVERVTKDLPADELKTFPPEKDWKFWEAGGCTSCGHSGTRGRVAVHEVLRMTRELEEIILSTPSESNIGKEAQRQGMVTMLQDGIRKALSGDVALEEILRVVEEREDLEA